MERHINMGLRNLKLNNSEYVPKINKMRMQRIPDLSQLDKWSQPAKVVLTRSSTMKTILTQLELI